MHGGLVLIVSFAYLGLLFAIAYYGDKRAEGGRSIIANPYIYALSLAVYCTAWTFYGSVGRAAVNGVGFLPIYIGPTLMVVLWWVVLRKIIRISKYHRITSIADFIASRYGKSGLLAGLVTVIAVTGVVPYIALQLKAISDSFLTITEAASTVLETQPWYADTALYVAVLLSIFAILFGTRNLDVTERHEGVVAAVAFESLVKLIAFLVVGFFVVFGMFGGMGEIFRAAATDPDIRPLFTFEGADLPYVEWFSLTILSMMAIMFLPRQFQVAVVENVDEKHLDRAIWLFPAYLIAINIFVLPIALGGLLFFGDANVDADMFVLTLPLAAEQEFVALLVFIGGLSAATGMVIVASIALSTMISNDLVMPILLRIRALRIAERARLTGFLLSIRRLGIVLVLLLAFGYHHLVGGAYALVSIGLISFAAVSQFGPVILGGIFWRHATHAGAMAALVCGFLVWGYTLVLPSLAEVGILPQSIVDEGLWGVAAFRPRALFGLDALDELSHSLFWSMLVNVGLFVGVSLFTRQSIIEQGQARSFVDVFKYSGSVGESMWRGTANVADLRMLLRRFLGRKSADASLQDYLNKHGLDQRGPADPELVHHTEKLLAGAIGASSARVVVASVVKEEPLDIGEVMELLDEAQQVMAHSKELERKSAELERATAELRVANEQLQQLDRLKDDFISTVTHELRTPLTAIRAFAEILQANPDLESEKRQEFLGIVIEEGERLTRLINQVLKLQKLDAGTEEFDFVTQDLREIVRAAASAMSQHIEAQQLELVLEEDSAPCFVRGDRDQLLQVVLNLLSNAVKFTDRSAGPIFLRVIRERETARVEVQDRGPGLSAADRQVVFERFKQLKPRDEKHPPGSGLGLAIAKRIVHRHGGTIGVDSEPGQGATFYFILPTHTPETE